MQQSITIQKDPAVTDGSNYELLRRKGLEYIEELGSSIWTDYNIHDPGITLLELLCYAITDLGYRSSFNIKDILAGPDSKTPKEEPKRQGFFTAREILTVNPWTIADFRKLLIDIDGIKNAWLTCKEDACNGPALYANCKKGRLQYENENGSEEVILKGFYDVLVEFENEAGAGDLNSGKIKYNFSFPVAGGFSTAMIEMRLPSWQAIQLRNSMAGYFTEDAKGYDKFLQLINPSANSIIVKVDSISGNLKDKNDMPADQQAALLRRVVYSSITIHFKADSNSLEVVELRISDIAMNLWFSNDADRKQVKLNDIKEVISDASFSGIFGKYLTLIHQVGEVMQLVNDALHSNRNLCEDYCSIKAIAVQDIGVCTDMEVEPSADIEAVLAETYYRIDQYFSPDIKFYSLKELMDEGVPVDEIFEGPQLSNGFINNDQLDTTNLKEFIYTSDIINLLMDIPGVKSISQFILSKFDTEGNLIISKDWVMPVDAGHQPRLYLEASKILVFKNGLPFLPDKLELSDSLQVIKGKHSQPKYNVLDNDLPVPQGQYYQLSEYYPLQYSLPLTYGVGYSGLPSTASVQRQAQAKQLKAYLLFYEQILVNYLDQLTNVKELFALDTTVKKTYFSRRPDPAEISGTGEIFNGLTDDILYSLVESTEVFFDRRNRFLNHLLSRFSENFNDYALMLYSYSTSKAVADEKLVKDKIRFLKDFPLMSAGRASAVNYKVKDRDCSKENLTGLELRIRRLLGMEDFGGFFAIHEEKDTAEVVVSRRWQLKDETGKLQLISKEVFMDSDAEENEKRARAEIAIVKKNILISERYPIEEAINGAISLTDETGKIIATSQQVFTTKAAAEAARDEIMAFGEKLRAADKVYVVEHLLLRPRIVPSSTDSTGDSNLLTICLPPGCNDCKGEEDPYSFRLTIVLSGETGIANNGIEFRRFAEQTIRTEVPAHLGVKICWVSNIQLARFEIKYCAWLKEMATDEPDQSVLESLLAEFLELKSVYPKARLHDCVDGDDSNRVFLDNTII